MGNGHSSRRVEGNSFPLWRRKELELREIRGMLRPINIETPDAMVKRLVGNEIFFWSWTLAPVREHNYSKLFIVHTRRDIGYDVMDGLIKEKHPDWRVDRFHLLQLHKNLYIPAPFFISHAIEIRTPGRMLWKDMVYDIVGMLEGIL
jgi:hypothetical protein